MKTNIKEQNWVVYLATFPPRECGIATFTKDLTDSLDNLISPNIQSKIIAMNTNKLMRFPYDKKVIYQIDQPERQDYTCIAKKINKQSQIKLIVVQHEFGIFGGEYGSYVIDFLREVKKPVVITFHSVLPHPNPSLLKTVSDLTSYCQKIVVMTNLSKEVLIQDYEINEDKIVVIPHGIHPCEFIHDQKEKERLGLDKRIILSTFGLLSPGKGIEYVIRSLPEVIKKFPRLYYLVIGATHPSILKQDGETYRNFLENEVKRLKLKDHVRFYNKYLCVNELISFLQATSVYVSSNLDPNQAVSGTFSYALGTGRPVISTAFSQAKEYINNKVGLLVDFKKPAEYSKAIIKLLSDEKLCWEMGKEAYFKTRNMTWPNVALSYLRLFQQIVPEFALLRKSLPEIKMDHLTKMTDGFGILQFAELSRPDIKWGYTLDDNARALMVAGLYYEQYKNSSALHLIDTYLKFIKYVTRPNGYFYNYVDLDRKIDISKNEKEGLEDATTRCLRSLAWLNSCKSIPKKYRTRAEKKFSYSLSKKVTFSSPRAIAFYTQALYYWWLNHRNKEVENMIANNCNLLIKHYNENSDKNWQWFDGCLTYSNSIMCEALLNGYLVTKNPDYLKIGRQTLDFLILNTFVNDIYIPIGQDGWYKKNGDRKFYDQQPEEVATMVQTLKEMYKITGNEQYQDYMYKTFYWFLGDNTLKLSIYDRAHGGCYDGLGEDHVNLNQGAESTISYLLARLILDENHNLKDK